MSIADDAQRSGNTACFCPQRERSWTGERPALGRTRSIMDEALAMEIESLRKLKTKALQARYRELFGEESRSSNCAYLFRRIAWRLQAKAQGDLSERARKRAAELADDADLRLRAPRRFWRTDGSVGLEPSPARDPRLPPVGTVLKRVYGERTIESDRARDRVRISGKILSLLEPDCAARDRNTLERVSLLRAPEGTRPMRLSLSVVRCAIYTRKSTEEGLEQSFNTLQAQRESAEAYILSHKQESWHTVPTVYNDGGFSGASLERPALKQLLADIEAHRIDCVVVYKVDRLSRSLLDFTRLLSLFDNRGVSFVSVTQDFNTSTSMGRLTLNILLSFAQFEREIIGERTRDKLSAARRKGKWIGGTPVLGYDVAPEGGRLVVNAVEAERVRDLFALCACSCSMTEALGEARARGWTAKQWTSRNGKTHGGQLLGMSTLRLLVTNVLYRGDITHQGVLYPGEHPALVSRELWHDVNAKHKLSRAKIRSNDAVVTPLQGLVRCAQCGALLTTSFTGRQGQRHRYYVCRAGKKEQPICPQQPVRADDLAESL